MRHANSLSASIFGNATRGLPVNEPVRSYAPGSRERAQIQTALNELAADVGAFKPYIGGRWLTTDRLSPVVMPHDFRHVLGHAHQADAAHVRSAIDACAAAWPSWSRMDAGARAAIFLKAADLLAGPWRDRLNAATMLGQSKTVHQAEIDSAAEFIDFLRFNVHFMERIYADQPISGEGVWNRADYRPLEGFVFAITPFNFTAIAGNLPCAPALMGNTVLWKPSATAALSAHVIMELLIAAGLPPGVINLVHGEPAEIANVAFANPGLAGVHFTGSTAVFNGILREVGSRTYRNYPRVVGETGGKNFILAHASADIDALTTAIIRGAFEYQGQKCSAASRVFVPSSSWQALKAQLADQMATIRHGDVRDFTNFMGAVIDERAWTRLADAIESGKADPQSDLVFGGKADRTQGYFIGPTLFTTRNPEASLIRDELFGPIATVVVYDEADFDGIVQRIDGVSAYALTGSIFAQDRTAVARAMDGLRYAAGNFYINDKPTGAIVGQQPFGGARASGTNDKAGSMWNLTRWVSPRTIKETFVPPTRYAYPFMS